MEMQAAIERLQLDINGSLGRLDPLDGADLALKLEHPDLGGMLENLRLPVVATGTLNVDARLKDAGKLTQLDFDAKLGDIAAKSNGTLKTLGLPGSDLQVRCFGRRCGPAREGIRCDRRAGRALDGQRPRRFLERGNQV